MARTTEEGSINPVVQINDGDRFDDRETRFSDGGVSRTFPVSEWEHTIRTPAASVGNNERDA